MGHHHVMLTISLALCVIILVVLLVAIFAAIRHHILALNVVRSFELFKMIVFKIFYNFFRRLFS